MQRKIFIQTIRGLGYVVKPDSTGTSIHIYLNRNPHLILFTIDDTKPYAFTAHDMFHLMHYTKKENLYRLVSEYAATTLIDRN